MTMKSGRCGASQIERVFELGFTAFLSFVLATDEGKKSIRPHGRAIRRKWSRPAAYMKNRGGAAVIDGFSASSAACMIGSHGIGLKLDHGVNGKCWTCPKTTGFGEWPATRKPPIKFGGEYRNERKRIDMSKHITAFKIQTPVGLQAKIYGDPNIAARKRAPPFAELSTRR